MDDENYQIVMKAFLSNELQSDLDHIRHIKSQTRRRAWMEFIDKMAEPKCGTIWVIQGTENETRDWQGESYSYSLRISRAQTRQVTFYAAPSVAMMSNAELCQSALGEIGRRIKKKWNDIFIARSNA